MEASTLKASPFPPASDVPLHRNPPLAPSQELAYRNKCIHLKRRLNEIETNNDSTRKRIATERERVQKMRLLRAILLNQLKEVMTTTGKSLSTEQLNKLGITEAIETEQVSARPEGETLLDDSSDESEDEEIPEPRERPTRMRRTNNNYRETAMNSSTPKAPLATAASYAQTGLPNLAPANTYSPSAARDPAIAPQRSSYHVNSTPLAAAAASSPPYSQHSSHTQQYGTDSRYSSAAQQQQHSSPIQQHQTIYASNLPTQHESNGVPAAAAAVVAAPGSSSQLIRPVKPDPPFMQFQTHMRPQLEADNYPSDQIEARIDEEWRKLSDENRGLWEQRYQEQVVEYQQDLDAYNHHHRGREYR